jgi:hypothetical protein
VVGESQLDKSVASWIMDGTFSIVFIAWNCVDTRFLETMFYKWKVSWQLPSSCCRWSTLYDIYLTLSRLFKHTNIASLQHENLSWLKWKSWYRNRYIYMVDRFEPYIVYMYNTYEKFI